MKLASEIKLGKINNHVHFQGSNATPLSHEAVLAVKNAFVKALSSNGVAADEIAKIRRELGLSAETGIDKTLHARSIRPLTRQQVRDILDPVARNKANFAMTLVSQGTHNAVLFGFGVALDPDRSTSKASFAVNGNPERSFELEFDENGGLSVRFRTRQKTTAVITGVDAAPCGPGSEVAVKLDLHVNAEELDRIGGVDFAAYDDKPITQIIDDERPENDNKFVKAKFALPERFRLAIDVGPGLVADLK